MHGLPEETGADAVLCGEALMRSEDVEELVHDMKARVSTSHQINAHAFITI